MFSSAFSRGRFLKIMEKLKLQTIKDTRGSITVAEKLPFEMKRIYYLHGVKDARGGHAQRVTDRLMIAVAGSFRLTWRRVGDVETDATPRWGEHLLWTPTEALRIPPMTWLELGEFSTDAVCLVIASHEFEASDSIRDFAQFLSESRVAA